MTQSPEEKKEKARWRRILKVYGITREQYGLIDNGSCPVCLRSWSVTVRPCIDHDHVTGHIRGLLCGYCNHYRVGRHRDHDLVYRIAQYLTPPFTEWVVPKKPKKQKKKKNAKKDNSVSRRASKSGLSQPKVRLRRSTNHGRKA